MEISTVCFRNQRRCILLESCQPTKIEFPLSLRILSRTVSSLSFLPCFSFPFPFPSLPLGLLVRDRVFRRPACSLVNHSDRNHVDDERDGERG